MLYASSLKESNIEIHERLFLGKKLLEGNWNINLGKRKLKQIVSEEKHYVSTTPAGM